MINYLLLPTPGASSSSDEESSRELTREVEDWVYMLDPELVPV